jgi:diaminobutyrate-2-oxoglutarate transaminase
MQVIGRLESEVRSYCRSFPTVFDNARGARLVDRDGRSYVDFFAGAGALNYGHNDPKLKERLIAYLERDGIVHGLDMATTAKVEFLERFEDRILEPRDLEYKVQFPGPTGTNAVESALKLARKVTGREGIVSFTNAFHGMTLGSLAVTGNGFKRRGAGVPLHFGDALPFDGFLGEGVDTLDILEAMLDDDGSGIASPAAVIVETTQAEGGLNVASDAWLRRLQGLCRRFGSLLIVDDIQVGIGRTGPFFSFERAGLEPDLVCLSKSLSGYGLPMAVVLIRPDLDVWEPGEHNGTFRGNNPAFVTASAALDEYWCNDRLSRDVEEKAETLRTTLEDLAARHPDMVAQAKGIGLIQGLEFVEAEMAGRVCRKAFEHGLIMETAGPEGGVAKVMPPLTIDEVSLKEGLALLVTTMDEMAGGTER